MHLAGKPDSELSQMAQRGQRGAIQELFARHDARAYETALKMLRYSHGDASDAVQQARISAWRAIAQLEGDFNPWYIAIVRNACRKVYNRKQRTVDWMHYNDSLSSVGAVDRLIEIERGSFLQGLCTALLPPQQMKAVGLKYIQGYEYSEIAQELDIAEKTARNHVQLGLQTLQEHLKGWY